MSRVLTCPSHELITILEEIQTFAECPTNVIKFPLPLLYKCFLSSSQVSHLVFTSNTPLHCNFPFSTRYISPQIYLNEGKVIRDDPNPPLCFRQLFPIEPNESRFFTDGSKSADLPFAGFAVVDSIRNIDYRFRTSNKTSIFSCEAMAILSALRITFKSPNKKISIFSDSKSVLSTLLPSRKNKKNSSNIIFSILDLLEKFNQKGKEVSLIWIPSHLNIEGNERTDRMTKEAIFTGADAEFLLSPNDMKALWRDKMYYDLFEWGKTRGLVKGSYFFKHFPLRNRKLWFSNFNFSRKNIASINRLRSGHTTLAECLFKHNVTDSPFYD